MNHLVTWKNRLHRPRLHSNVVQTTKPSEGGLRTRVQFGGECRVGSLAMTSPSTLVLATFSFSLGLECIDFPPSSTFTGWVFGSEICSGSVTVRRRRVIHSPASQTICSLFYLQLKGETAGLPTTFCNFKTLTIK